MIIFSQTRFEAYYPLIEITPRDRSSFFDCEKYFFSRIREIKEGSSPQVTQNSLEYNFSPIRFVLPANYRLIDNTHIYEHK